MFVSIIAQDDDAAHLVVVLIPQDRLAAFVFVFIFAQDGDTV